MTQKHEYPDPDQLRAFAEEPMPFHDIAAQDLELLDGNVIRVGYENVEYRFDPTYINVELEVGEYVSINDVDGVELTHRQAWELAPDLEIGEDYIVVHEFVDGPDGEPMAFDAYWLLSTVTVENRDIKPPEPDGWHWGIGERTAVSYTRWLYTDAILYRDKDSEGSHFGAEITVYWDEGGQGHTVTFLPYTGMKSDGDPEYGDEKRVGVFDSELDALWAAVDTARKLR